MTLEVEPPITNVAMHNALRPAFELWLASRGLRLVTAPDGTHIVMPTQETWDKMVAAEQEQWVDSERLTEWKTKTGKILTDTDIQALADEVEKKYEP